MNRVRWFLLAFALPPLAGCFGMNWGLPSMDGMAVREDRDRRGEAMVREFEARRNAVQIEAAEAALERGDHRESERIVRAVVQRDAAHRDARLLLAELLLLTGRRPEAFTQLEHALREHGDDPLVHFAMALLLDASGRPDEAQAFYARSVELNPDLATYAAAHETIPDMDVSIDVNGTKASAVNSVSYLTTETEESFREVREALTDGCEDTARAAMDAAMAADPHNPQISVQIAVLALEYNHPQTAVAVLKPAAAQFPKAVAVHRTLGAAYYRLNDYGSAEAALRHALSLDNSDGLSYLLMGCTLEKLGQPKAAATQFERAAALRAWHPSRR